MVDEKDTITRGFFKASQFKPGIGLKFKVVAYKHYQGGKFPDKDGMSTEYLLQPLTESLKELADDKGNLMLNCNSKRLRSAFLAADVDIGDVVIITQSGKGFDTKYDVVKLEDQGEE